MNIEEYLEAPHELPNPSIPFLTDFDALWDSILIDLRFNFVFNRISMLIHGMGMPSEYNTGVLVMHEVSNLQVTSPGGGARDLRTIHLWRPANGADGWSIETSTERGGSLSATARAAEFVVGITEGGERGLPDFAEASDQQLASGVISWRSEFTPLARQVVGLVKS